MKNKKYRSIKGQLSAKLGFSFVELIIVIAVIALISVIGMSINNNYTEKSKNSKITSDIKTIQNSLESYKNETKTLPLPKGNQKYFDDSANYVHYDDTTAYGVYGNITEDTIPKKYMNYTPIDPRTNQYYAYGKTLTGDLAFEIAGINKVSNRFESVVVGDYVGDNGPYNLIREYNGPDFVYDKSKNNFPYNPEERVVKAKIGSFSGEVLVNNIPINKNWIDNNELISGDEIFVGTGGQAEIFYSDGSKSYLGDEWKGSKLVLANMTYKGENNLFTKIQLALDYGSIWTKTSKLDSNSEFEIYTTDTEAAVRGTIFGVEKNTSETNITAVNGKMELIKIASATSFDTINNNLKNGTLVGTGMIGTMPTSTKYTYNMFERTLTIYPDTDTGNPSIATISSSPSVSVAEILPTLIPTLPNEDGLENIKPKIKSIDNKEVKLEFPTSFSGTSNGKKVIKNGGPLSDSLYKYDLNILTLSGAITPDNYTIKVCDSQEIKCTQEVSINKTLVYAGDPNACNPPYKVKFTGPEYTGCIDMDQSLVNSGYTLVAYAPLDGNANLYYHTGSFVTFNQGNISSSTYTNLGGTNYALNLTGPNELQYTTSGLGIGSSPYAIEMSVKGESLTGVTSTGYLFKDSNINPHFLFFQPNGNLTLGFYNGIIKTNKTKFGTNLLTLSSSYYKVISTFDLSNWGLKLIDSSSNIINPDFAPGWSETTNFPSIIFIGQDFTGSLDYVKIYKK